MQLGLVTYMWGAEWDLPTLIKNLEQTGFQGVELRTEQRHKHGVELGLTDMQKAEVARRFEESKVQFVGLGTSCEYQSPDPKELKRNIERTKEFIRLTHDLGGGGVKVRPNKLPPGVPVHKTLEQIGRSLNEVAAYGERYGIEIRLEIHGPGTAEIPNIQKIMEVAQHPNAKLCWNCNPEDLKPPGFEKNFKSLQNRIGTVHIHELISSYPWPQLFSLLKKSGFEGWTLLEENNMTCDPIRVMKYYRLLWETLAR